MERAHQSGSNTVPFCFSLESKSRLELGHFPTDSLPLKRGRQVFCSTLRHVTPSHLPAWNPNFPLPHLLLPYQQDLFQCTPPPQSPKSTYNVTHGIAHYSAEDLRFLVSILKASVSLPVLPGTHPQALILGVALCSPQAPIAHSSIFTLRRQTGRPVHISRPQRLS